MNRTTPTARFALVLVFISAFLLPFAGQANPQPKPLEYYETHLQGGQLMPEAPTPATTTVVIPTPRTENHVPPPVKWAPNFKLTMIAKSFRTGEVKIGIHNIREKDDYYLGIGERSGNNLLVQSVEFDEAEVATVLISKDGGEPEAFFIGQ